MIKVGIIGADLPIVGEIIRILVNHPETEIVSLISPSHTGRAVSALHHGLIGETQLFFSDKIDTENIDFLIIANSDLLGKDYIDKVLQNENLKVVFSNSGKSDIDYIDNFEIGLSEINRKALVRGARAAYIPSTAIIPSFIALSPLAQFLLLNSDINIAVNMPHDIAILIDEVKESEKIKKYLQTNQTSFNGNINLKVSGDHFTERGSTTTITLVSNLALSEIEKIYQDIYDDHNFTFLINGEVKSKEVEGTQKVIMSLKKPDPETLIIEVVEDARLRGGAGDIVHVMNLFFGLHEKTGLHLKASSF